MREAKPVRVLLVCTGNTCRSPMAAGLLQRAARERGVAVEVASAGTSALANQSATPEAVAVLWEKGIDISAHRSRRLEAGDVENADLVLTMTAAHRERVLEVVPDARERVYTLAEYATGEATDIPDPLGGDVERYRETAAVLERLVAAALDRMEKERSQSPP